jgi:UDP-glucuronate 4-epimerase
MKILITGCAGFIGFSIAKKILINKSNIVYGVDSLSNYYSTKVKKQRLSILKNFKNFYFKKKDLSKIKDVNEIFYKCKFDIVLHLAAQPGVRRSFDYPNEYYDSNVSSFFNILENSRKSKIKKILFASSSSVYGDSKKFPIIEKFNRKPKNFYALTKCINEDMAKFYSEVYNMKIIGLRFFTLYGPFGRPDMLVWKLCENILFKKNFNINNYGKHERDFTYIDDAIKMILNIIKFKDNEKFNVFNICSNNPVKLKYVINLFVRLGKNKLLKNFKYQKFQNGDVIKTHGSNLKVLKNITNFKFTSIESGVKQTFNWFKQYNKIK